MFSFEALVAYQAALDEVSAQIDALPGPSWVIDGDEISETDYGGCVELWLNMQGHPYRVAFSNGWLAREGSPQKISRAVMNCYRWAKEKWTPPRYVLTERGELMRRHAQIRAELDVVIGNGIRY